MRRILTWMPPLMLGLAGSSLALHWNQLPEQWPTHWGTDGQPDGWTHRSAGSASLVLVIGGVMWLAMESLAWWLERRQHRVPQVNDRDVRLMSAALADTVRLVTVAQCGLMAFLGGALPVHPEWFQSRSLAVLLLGLMLAGVALSVVNYYWRVRRVPRPEGYNALVYCNPHDKRLWVPKLVGVGWTINFAHPAAWPSMLIFVSIMAAVVAAATHRLA